MVFDYRKSGYMISNSDQKLIESKFTKLKKFSPLLTDESVKFHINILRGVRHQSPHFGLRVRLTLPKKPLSARASGKTLADAVDEVERKLSIQIRELQSKKSARDKL
jgi:ribosomal subunit interface protein